MAIEAVGYIRTEKIILKAGLFSKNHIVNVHIDPQTGFTVANYIGRENGNGGLRSSRRINNLERRALEQLKYDPTKVMANIEGKQNQIREPEYFHPRLRTLQVQKLEINDPDDRIEHGATLHAMTYGYTPDVSKHTPDIVLAAMQGQNPESQVISTHCQVPNSLDSYSQYL